jgi:hypothetical protein
MSLLDGLFKGLQTNEGQMAIRIFMDAMNNHLIPYAKDKIQQAMKPTQMSQEEAQQSAEDDFAPVDEHVRSTPETVIPEEQEDT